MLQSAELFADWRERSQRSSAGLRGRCAYSVCRLQRTILELTPVLADGTLDADAPFAPELTQGRAISRDDLVKASIKEIRRLSPTTQNSELIARWELGDGSVHRRCAAGTITGV